VTGHRQARLRRSTGLAAGARATLGARHVG
jgi:hypothetical protein